MLGVGATGVTIKNLIVGTDTQQLILGRSLTAPIALIYISLLAVSQPGQFDIPACGNLVVTGNEFRNSTMNALTLIGKDSPNSTYLHQPSCRQPARSV